MDALAKLEAKLNELLVSKAPWQLSENVRKWIATYAWAFALIGAVLGAVSGLLLLTGVLLATAVSTVVVDPYTGTTVTTGAIVHHYLALAWVALVILLGYVVLLVAAVPKLKALHKSGWNLLFYSSLFFVAYDVFSWLQYPRAVGSLIFNLIGAVVGLYFLFQVRSYFGRSKVGPKVASSTPVPKA
jgi:hypothetical protein